MMINAGYRGNNTRDLLARVEKDVVPHQPDLVVLLVGGNDGLNSGNAVPMDEYPGNLRKLIRLLRDDVSGKRRLILMTATPCNDASLLRRYPTSFYPPGGPSEAIDRVNAVIRTIAAEEDVVLVDLYQAFRQVDDWSSRLLQTLENSGNDDGLHPTEAGYRLVAEKVAEAIKHHELPHERVVCFGDSLTAGVGVAGTMTATGATYPAVLARLLSQE